MGNQQKSIERRQYWAELVERWRTSGMTKKGFCETNELKYDTFVRWTYRITPEDGEQMFVEIPAKPAERKSFTAGSSTVELECSGVTLRVPLCIDERELSRLLRAVENR